MNYAELLCCSHFSFQRGASSPLELVTRAKALGYSAVAITDECTVAGVVRAYEAAKETSLQLIIGSQFRLPMGDRIVLLAPDHDAYTQLCSLITKARRHSKKGSYRISDADFLSGVDRCIGLWLPAAQLDPQRAAWFAQLTLLAHYLACTHELAQDSDAKLATLIKLGCSLQLPCVAVGDVHYHIRERRPLHDVLTAIRLGTTVDRIGRAGFANGERHLRPVATLQKLFPAELLQASVAIANHCKFSLEQLRYQYPHELVPQGLTPAEHLRQRTEAGARKRWPNGVPSQVRAQIEKELALIAELHYEHYFLTVEDLVRYARENNILCQGRGSAANSVVCYALQVTEVDPARISMLFERFISKERAEPPDIDIDFEHQRREEIIQYIYRKYGRERAALAATVVCYRRRMAVRDVGRALGLPMDLVNALSTSLRWFDGGEVLSDELARLGFDPRSLLAKQLLVLAKQLLGFPRHLSQHVGGFVISEHPLSTLVPFENAAMPNRTIIQWDKDDLESLGLLKVDCLALGMLSAIRRTLAMIGRYRGQPFVMQDIPAEDPATYDMLGKAESIGVFQVESRAQMSMLPRLKPRRFYDLVIQVAIVRPGPIQGGMVHPYLKRRQGLEQITYPSDALKSVLGRTQGVPIFQEQVMQIAIVAAGFTPGEADQVRRSMAAWQRRGGLDHFRDKLINGMLARGYKQEFAEQIYQQILGFGEYGFPESHAASFALLAYASAWLRCHEPAAFCAGLLNSMPMGFYSAAQLVTDARRRGVCFRPVDVQTSEWDCTLERGEDDKPVVRLGMRMIHGLSEMQAKAIEQARMQAHFVDLNDLTQRANLPHRTLDILAHAGALAALAGQRPAARWAALGVEHLPPLLAAHSATEAPVNTPIPSEGQELVADYKTLGVFMGRHPIALLRSRLQRLGVRQANQLQHLRSGQRVRVAGLVTHRQRPQTASNIIFISLEDETGLNNLIVRDQVVKAQRQAVLGAQLMIVQGELQHAAGVIHVIAEKVRDYSHWLGALDPSSRDFQ